MARSQKVGGTSKATTLTHSFYNPLITKEVIKSVTKIVDAIDKILIGERKASIDLGELLAKLRREMDLQLRNSSSANDYQIKLAFHNFVQIRFKLGESRVKEYIRLAEREDLHRLGLPISVLIELSRLEPKPLKNFMAKYPTPKLKQLPFKEIKKLVREKNNKKRSTSSKNSDGDTNPEKIAVKLKNTFEIVKDNFADEVKLDKNLDSVLKEIYTWYSDKKIA